MKYTALFFLIVFMTIVTIVPAQWAEDFSGFVDIYNFIDDYNANSETVQTTDATIPNRRLDSGLNSGSWGGYASAGTLLTIGPITMTDGVVSFVAGTDSSFGKTAGAGDSYLYFMPASDGGDERSSYTYTYFPTNPANLGLPGTLIEWDACDKNGANSSVDIRLMLRNSVTGVWTISDPYTLLLGTTWANDVVGSADTNVLEWYPITIPSGTVLDSLANSDETPLAWPPTPLTPAEKATYLASVDGFGFYMDTDLPYSPTMPPSGVYIDALRFNIGGTSVDEWNLY